MSTVDLSIHRVTKVEVRDHVVHATYGTYVVTHFTIHHNDGEETELTLFSVDGMRELPVVFEKEDAL